MMILQPALIEQDQMQHCQKETPVCVSPRKCSCWVLNPAQPQGDGLRVSTFCTGEWDKLLLLGAPTWLQHLCPLLVSSPCLNCSRAAATSACCRSAGATQEAFALACPDMWTQTPTAEWQSAQQRLEDVMGWGTGLGQFWLPHTWLYNTFLAPESRPRAPAHPSPGEW